MKRIVWFLLLAGLTVGCESARRARVPPLTQADVIALVQAGETDEAIMRRIDSTGTVFQLSADDIVRLRQAGVSDRLVTYMNDTKVRAAVEQERRRSYYEHRWHYGFGIGYIW
jgi:hypothetical protein